MTPIFQAIPTSQARHCQNGGLDAYGQPPEHAKSGGHGYPCRHCLRDIPEGAEMLILAYRPFDDLGPYSETGPIFLCAEPCARHDDGTALPPILSTSPDYLVKGYSADDRIVYGTGAVVAVPDIAERCAEILARPDIAYLHVRSSRNNCFQAKVVSDDTLDTPN